MQNLSEFKRSLSLVLSLIFLAFVCCGCQISVTTKPSSSSESQALESSSDSKGEFAAKYKNHIMELDEYKMIVFYMISGVARKEQSSIEKNNLSLEDFVRSGSFEGQSVASYIKQSSAAYAKLALVAREKLTTLGKDLSQERKMSISASEDEKYLEFSKIYNISLNEIKESLQDHERILILKQENIDVSESELGEVTVNEDVIGKIDVVDLAKSAQNFWTKQVLDFN